MVFVKTCYLVILRSFTDSALIVCILNVYLYFRLVFSQSLYSLDLIEHFLGKVDEATQDGRIDDKLGGHVGEYIENFASAS